MENPNIVYIQLQPFLKTLKDAPYGKYPESGVYFFGKYKTMLLYLWNQYKYQMITVNRIIASPLMSRLPTVIIFVY